MKILVLIVITTWSFGCPLPPKQVIYPSSVEDAAFMVYKTEKNKSYPEPDQYSYRLLEIDLERETIKQICIPTVEFKSE